MAGGIPSKGYYRHWGTPDDLYADWTKFKAEKAGNMVWVEGKAAPYQMNKPLPITIEGFCAWAKIARSKFYEYKTRPEYREIMELMDNEHEAYINEGAAIEAFNPNWHKVYMGNKFGYADRSVSVTAGIGGMSESDKQLLNKMAGVLGIGEGAIECDEYSVSQGEAGAKTSE